MKKNTGHVHMKFQNPSIHHSKVNRRTHRQTDRQTDRQAESNMPFQLFQSWGHKNRRNKNSCIQCTALQLVQQNSQYK